MRYVASIILGILLAVASIALDQPLAAAAKKKKEERRHSLLIGDSVDRHMVTELCKARQGRRWLHGEMI